jgi:hypothetical protein
MSYDVNQALQRSIKDGSEYDQYLPKVQCLAQDLGNGNNNTIEGVEFMADWITQHSHQVKKLAEKLKKSSLESSVISIYIFLYIHFQYNADKKLQKLRSPACSWKQRKEGIDCKSYTIFAVALLREMGYTSFIRQIKQPGYYENEFTHVYAIVPEDQDNVKATNYYTKPYYVIDPTTHDNIEPNFIYAKDKLMNGLPYKGLNGGCSPRLAKKVVKASNAGRRLQQGKTTGGRDLAKWRWGLLGTSEVPKSLQNLLMLEPYILKAGFSQQTFNRMYQFVLDILESGYPSSEIRFYPVVEGFKIFDASGQGVVFKHPNPQNGQWLNRFVESTQYSGLNSQNPGTGNKINLDSVFKDVDFSSLLDDLGSFISGIFGGSDGWYKEHHIKENVQKLIDVYVQEITDLNKAIQNNNPVQAGIQAEKIKQYANAVYEGFKIKRNEGWGNKTNKRLEASRDLSKRFSDNVRSALQSYISNYLNPVSIPGQNFTLSSNDFGVTSNGTIAQMMGVYVGKPFNFSTTINTGYSPKQNIQIPAFELNQQLIESIVDDKALNNNSWLNSLANVIQTVTSPGGSSNNQNTNPGTFPGTNPGTVVPGNANTPGGGLSTANLGILAVIGAGILFRKPIMNALNSKK